MSDQQPDLATAGARSLIFLAELTAIVEDKLSAAHDEGPAIYQAVVAGLMAAVRTTNEALMAGASDESRVTADVLHRFYQGDHT